MQFVGSRTRPHFTAGAVPARYLGVLVHHLQSLGHKVEQPLAAVGLTMAQLSHPAARIDRRQLSAALQQLAASTGRTDLGFELGMQLSLGVAHELSLLFLSAPSYAAGLVYASRYFALITPSYRFEVEHTSTGYRARVAPARPLPYDVAVLGLEIIAVAVYRFGLFLGQTQRIPFVLDLSWPAPPHAHRYRELKGVQVRFGAGVGERLRMALFLPTALAETPLPMANPLATRELEEACERRLRELGRGQSWTEWVSTMLLGVEERFPTQAELAAMVGIAPRTLARALRAEGREYQALASGLRHARARELLREAGLSLSEIAHRLGYSDAANFSRAFRRLEGVNPGQFRARAQSVATTNCNLAVS